MNQVDDSEAIKDILSTQSPIVQPHGLARRVMDAYNMKESRNISPIQALISPLAWWTIAVSMLGMVLISLQGGAYKASQNPFMKGIDSGMDQVSGVLMGIPSVMILGVAPLALMMLFSALWINHKGDSFFT